MNPEGKYSVIIQVHHPLRTEKTDSQKSPKEIRNQLTFHRWQAQLPRNLRISNLPRIIEGHTPHKLSQITAAGNGATATESLELDIADGVVIWVDADLKLHYIAASGSSDEPGAYVGVGFWHGTDIARGGVVV